MLTNMNGTHNEKKSSIKVNSNFFFVSVRYEGKKILDPVVKRMCVFRTKKNIHTEQQT